VVGAEEDEMLSVSAVVEVVVVGEEEEELGALSSPDSVCALFVLGAGGEGKEARGRGSDERLLELKRRWCWSGEVLTERERDWLGERGRSAV
jgi:hypothetical protein